MTQSAPHSIQQPVTGIRKMVSAEKLSAGRWSLLVLNRIAFTFIEILITISLLGILFVPMMNFFSQAVNSTNTSRDLITAANLARWDMERLKNLGTQLDQLRPLSNTSWPAQDEPAFLLNDTLWRIDRQINTDALPWEVRVSVRIDGETDYLASLVTYITETSWVQ